MNSEQQEFPWCEEIHGGKWAAHGDGWAVHGDTKEEALEKYHRVEQRRREILAHPPVHSPLPCDVDIHGRLLPPEPGRHIRIDRHR